MATSPNFGWLEPDNTDLVKNGALAIRTAVNAIDASLAELKGGTTGQVLSKTSGTDMDFTWVTSDDANAIQNTIVDAKGDLISATGSDVPARLAVGANYGFLQADSAQSTGLTWNAGAWTTYTPTITAGTGTLTTLTNIAAGYQRIGKTCIVRIQFRIAVNGTGATSLKATLPFSASGSGGQCGSFKEIGVSGKLGSITPDGANPSLWVLYDNTYPGGDTTICIGTLVYEVA